MNNQMTHPLVAVASRSFSADPFLKKEIIQKYTNVKFNESGASLSGSDLVDFLKDADKAIIALEKVDTNLLSQLPKLKVISKYGVGLDNIDFSALQKHKVELAWQGGVNKRSVAELALHFIIGCVRGSFQSHHDVQKNIWTQFKGQNLTGKTVGILGLGHIGQELISFLKPFNVNIIGFDLYERNISQVKQTDLDTLLKESDVVTIHLPHTTKTHHILNHEKLKLMKAGSFLVNTARGGLVDEKGLYDLLLNKHIQSAAFDVFEAEPPKNNALLTLDNFYSTGHIGGSSMQSIQLMGLAAIEGLSQSKQARPENFFDYPL